SAGAVHARAGAGQPRGGCFPPGDDWREWRSARVLVERAGRLDHHAGAFAAIVAAVRAFVATRQAAVAPGGLARGVIVAPTVSYRGGAAWQILGKCGGCGA